MPTVDDVKEQLRAIGIGRLGQIGLPLPILATTMHDDERIALVMQGRFSDRACTIVATDERLIMASPLRGVLGKIPLSTIESVVLRTTFLSGFLKLTVAGRDVELPVIEEEKLVALHEYLRASVTPPTAPGRSATTTRRRRRAPQWLLTLGWSVALISSIAIFAYGQATQPPRRSVEQQELPSFASVDDVRYQLEAICKMPFSRISSNGALTTFRARDKAGYIAVELIENTTGLQRATFTMLNVRDSKVWSAWHVSTCFDRFLTGTDQEWVRKWYDKNSRPSYVETENEDVHVVSREEKDGSRSIMLTAK